VLVSGGAEMKAYAAAAQALALMGFVPLYYSVKYGADVLRGDFRIDSGPGARGACVVDLEGRAIVPAGPFVTLKDIPRDVSVLSYSQSFVNPEVRDAQLLAGASVEDTYRTTPNLTLTLGVRWDYDSVTNTPAADGDWNNVAPRVGVSWMPRGSARHHIRGGYGIFYERIPFAVYSDTLFKNPAGGAVSVTLAPGTPFAPPAFPSALPRESVNALPLSELPPRNVQVFDPALESPSTQQVSAGYVFSVTSDFALAFDYVHSRGRHLIRRIDTNAPVPFAGGGTRSVAEADATRPIFNDRPAGFARDSERTPGFAQFDLGLVRRFSVGTASVEARAEVFNVFNRTNFSGFFNWGASGVRPDEQGTLDFQPTQAGPARQFQFTARVRF